jgi:hypothetical protein
MAAERRRRRELPEIEGVPVERGVGPARQDTTAPLETSRQILESLPQPYPSTAEGDLSPREREMLELCEAAVDNLATAFWAAGKGLQLIRDLQLYRDDTHRTFEEFVEDRFEISRAQAYRLIDAWPLGEILSPMGDKINERQVRALLPVADTYGNDAAVTVYRTIAETDGVRVTAKIIEGAVSVLPHDEQFDVEKAVDQIRAYLAGEVVPPAPSPVSPAEVWATEAGRVRTVLRRIRRDVVRAAAVEHRDEARQLADELRAMADELDQGTQ